MCNVSLCTNDLYSEFSIIRTPIICIRTLGCRLTSPCFWQQQEKDVNGHWSSATGESKAAVYEQLFPNATTFFIQYGI